MKVLKTAAKTFTVIIVAALIMCACASSNQSTITYETDSDGTHITHFEGNDSYAIKSIPYEKLDYNGSYFTLSDVKFYQLYSKEDYSYNLFVAVEMDLGTLTDAEVHWLLDDTGKITVRNVLDTSVYIKSEKNALDFSGLRRVYYQLDGSKLKQLFFFLDEQKYDFSDVHPSISVDIEQDETYEYKSSDGTTSKRRREKDYNYYPDPVELLDASEMPEEYVNAFTDYVARLTS